MRRAVHVLLCVLGLAYAPWANATTEVLKTSAGSPVHWTRTRISLALQMSAQSQSVSREAVERAMEKAAKTWNLVHAGQPHFFLSPSGDADVFIGFCRGKWQGTTIDLGRSQFTASAYDGSVSTATVEINECDHSFSVPDSAVPNGFDLQAVITHELGHVLGLGHSDNPTAVMHPNGRDGAHVRRPNVDDQTALALLYFGRFAANQDAAQGATQQATIEKPAKTAHVDKTAPALAKVEPAASELVSVLSLNAGHRRPLMVYTVEPTLLPPLGTAMRNGRSERSKRSLR